MPPKKSQIFVLIIFIFTTIFYFYGFDKKDNQANPKVSRKEVKLEPIYNEIKYTRKVLNFKTLPKVESKKIEPKKFALISCNVDDTVNYFYLFYLPITAQAWRLVGYEPLVLLVTSQKENLNKHALTTISYLKQLNVTLIYIDSEADYQLITSMVGRLLIGALDESIVKDEDFILTSDSDLIPIRKEYYSISMENSAITVWNAFCCSPFDYKGKSIAMYPIGHIGMRKYQWREMIGLKTEDKVDTKTVVNLVKRFFDDSVIKKNQLVGRGDSTWYLDQSIAGICIHYYVNEDKKAQTDLRSYTGFRLDRGGFFNLENLEKITDFHAFHQDLKEKWSQVQQVIKKLFNQNYYEDFYNKYYQEFFSN